MYVTCDALAVILASEWPSGSDSEALLCFSRPCVFGMASPQTLYVLLLSQVGRWAFRKTTCVVVQQWDHLGPDVFFPAWDLAAKGSKAFTKVCGSVSSHQKGIRNEVFARVESAEDVRIHSPALTRQPLFSLDPKVIPT